jgi:hypothetical protein
MNELKKLQAEAAKKRYIPAAYFAIIWMGLGNRTKHSTGWNADKAALEHVLSWDRAPG